MITPVRMCRGAALTACGLGLAVSIVGSVAIALADGAARPRAPKPVGSPDNRGCVTCPPGAIQENEPDCGYPVDTFNGGCDLEFPLFSPIDCGQTICGRSAVVVPDPNDPNFPGDPNFPYDPNDPILATVSDIDWYEFSVTGASTRVRLTVVNQFDLLDFQLFGVDCNDGIESRLSAECYTSTIQACLPEGTYRARIAHGFGLRLLCGTPYTLELQCEPCGPTASNDICADAIDLAIPSSVTGTNDNATSDNQGLDCGVGQNSAGVWYRVIGNGSRLTLTTCSAITNFDTTLSVYCGDSCDDLVCAAGNDDDLTCFEDGYYPEVYRSRVTWCSVAGATYWAKVSGRFDDVGDFELSLTSQSGACSNPPTCQPPPNDDCADAIMLALPSSIAGSTFTARPDAAPTCGTSISAPGVWYRVIGDGSTLTASTCNESSDYDLKLNVFCGDCGTLPCVVGADDTCGRQAQVSWCSQFGAEYLIFVQGYNGRTGDFLLEVSSNAVACTATIACIQNGACCVGDGCVQTTGPLCALQSGAFRGESTVCSGPQYLAYDDGADPFEDIAATGTASIVSNCDDCSQNGVALPFVFPFYEQNFLAVGIGSNGFLGFGSGLNDRNNVTIPNPNSPNTIICPGWDDLAPVQGGDVYYEARTFPDRFIVQWNNVPQYQVGDSNTFQVVLFVDGDIEFRYAAITPQAVGDMTIGIEDAAGLRGVNIPNVPLGAGNVARRIDRTDIVDGCACVGDLNGDGLIGIEDVAIMLSNYGSTSATPSEGDLDGDEDVDIQDLALLLSLYSTACP